MDVPNGVIHVPFDGVGCERAQYSAESATCGTGSSEPGKARESEGGGVECAVWLSG